MTYPWSDLSYWKTGEWQVVQEHLEDLKITGRQMNPKRVNLFKALSAVREEDVKVAIFGQDPYPQHNYASGVAFSIPADLDIFPQTLINIFKEYQDDLHYPKPPHGNLKKWTDQGVLLWNVIPSCTEDKSLSHDWEEYKPLTIEIIKKLNNLGCIIVLLGGKARSFVKYIDQERCEVIELSHPSPRASIAARNPFFGSRLFSTINSKLATQGDAPIDWRLDDGDGKGAARKT